MKDALGTVQSILVLGGASDIGAAIAARLAAPRHATVILAGRQEDALRGVAANLRAAGAARVETLPFDADDTDSHDRIMRAAAKLAGTDLDVILLAFGLLGDQERDEAGGDGAVRLARTNYVGTVSAGLAASRLLRSQGHGTLVFLSSVAGVRVRRVNFIYGSSKAGVEGFAQGLADALTGSGVNVLIVRPGFVRTKMTAGRPAAPLPSTADAVADATIKGLAAGRPIVWVPAYLRPVFGILAHLPRALWRRLPG
jgi:decaprenylphospho-beta-D-erythro-pentofuranosid-2-ulose 2-reductase